MEGLDFSSVSGFGMFITVLLAIFLLLLPRRKAFIPLIVVGCYVTLGQVFMVGGLHFSIARVLVLIGWIRIIVKGELANIEWNSLDTAIVLWTLSNSIVYVVRESTSEAVINRFGFIYNTFGMYFLFRCLIVDFQDLEIVFSILAMVVIPLAVFMVYERLTGTNFFSILGGVPEISQFRGGKYRAQGAFRHPILAGTFCATILPLFIGLWRNGTESKKSATVGILAAIVIILTSGSSGPLFAFFIGIIGMICWKYRTQMKLIRWGLFIGIISVHLIMKAPIWALIGRISDISGGTGYHRSELITAAVKHFNEWWLLGTGYTAHWGVLILPMYPKMVDITSEFIQQGVDGGVLTLLLFLNVIIVAYRLLGNSIEQHREKGDFAVEMIYWSIGVSLATHITSFISVSYFDQMVYFWLLTLSMMATSKDNNILEECYIIK